VLEFRDTCQKSKTRLGDLLVQWKAIQDAEKVGSLREVSTLLENCLNDYKNRSMNNFSNWNNDKHNTDFDRSSDSNGNSKSNSKDYSK